MAEADSLIRLTARDAVDALARREVRPPELVAAALDRITAVDGTVNALPTVAADRARARAARPDLAQTALKGLPLAIKDLVEVAGVRTTYGSPIFADRVPTESGAPARALEAAGGIVLAKSNTPEFGAGAQTFNPVFGRTLNPWNTDLTCGGSSGGAAVALATGMVWLAHGSDLGGSLRTPASFCSVTGMRPSPGLVARGPVGDAFCDLFLDGPMARNIGDLGLMLDAMTGADPIDPWAWGAAPGDGRFRRAAEGPAVPERVAYSPDLGITPVDPEVARLTEAAARRFEAMGARVEEASPDLSGATEVFQTLRAVLFATQLGPLLATDRDRLKPDLVWNIDKGLALTGEEVARARRERTALYHRMARFFDRYDLLLCPAAIVLPFPITRTAVEAVAGHRFDNYVAWLAITFSISLTACPALSLPCGFSSGGLPVGLQMVGRPRGDAGLLSAAAALEAELGLADAVPIDPMAPAT